MTDTPKAQERWSVTYRMSGPSELRRGGQVIATGGKERHPIFVEIAQGMNAYESMKAERDALRKALIDLLASEESIEYRFHLAVQGIPVRDMAETVGELERVKTAARAALSSGGETK